MSPQSGVCKAGRPPCPTGPGRAIRGYARRTRRLEWVAYDELLRAWSGSFRGRNPATAYRRFVTAAMKEPLSSPWSDVHHGWILGSRGFVERIRDPVQTARLRIAPRRRDAPWPGPSTGAAGSL